MSPSKTRPQPSRDLTGMALTTPALVWDIDILDSRRTALAGFAADHGCALLYSVKASGVGPVLKRLAPTVAGFACSSPFEARLARKYLGARKSVHLTSPALSARQWAEAAPHCDHVTFNSLGQWRALAPGLDESVQRGLRLNPGHSIVADPRFDPCRPGSKLGVPLADLATALDAGPEAFARIDGLHVHTACGNRSFKGLSATFKRIEAALPELLGKIHWFNLGGGYLFDKIRKSDRFAGVVSRLRDNYGVRVFIEPGTAMVQDAAAIVTTVVDMVDNGGPPIAVLDTTVNHMLEPFVYQYQPAVREAKRGARHTYVLAGATCLAGDILGPYDFRKPLKIGQRLTIDKVGAYTHGQSHWYNGVNLPAIYTVAGGRAARLRQAFDYDDFARRCAAG